MKIFDKILRCKRTYIHSFDFEFHVVFPGCLAIFPLLPQISIVPVFHLLPIVKEHAATLCPV